MAPGRDLYSHQEQVGISVSFALELMRMIKNRQMAGLEGEALSAAEPFYALAA